jgi:hypothetical protein
LAGGVSVARIHDANVGLIGTDSGRRAEAEVIETGGVLQQRLAVVTAPDGEFLNMLRSDGDSSLRGARSEILALLSELGDILLDLHERRVAPEAGLDKIS